MGGLGGRPGRAAASVGTWGVMGFYPHALTQRYHHWLSTLEPETWRWGDTRRHLQLFSFCTGLSQTVTKACPVSSLGARKVSHASPPACSPGAHCLPTTQEGLGAAQRGSTPSCPPRSTVLTLYSCRAAPCYVLLF